MALGTPLLSSPFTPNGRIEIYGQHGPCDGSSVTVSRTMPAILNGRLTDTQWTQFCNELDMELKPAVKMRKILIAGMVLLPVIFIAMGVLSFVSFSQAAKKQHDNFPPTPSFNDDFFTNNGNSNNNNSAQNDFMGSFIYFIIGGVILFVGFGILLFFMTRSKNSISSGLRKVCDKYSAQHPGISFHVRYEQRLWSSGYHHSHHHHHDGYHRNVHVSTTEYIEVYVASDMATTTPNVGGGEPSVVAQAFPIPSAPIMAVGDDPEVALGVGSSSDEQKPTAAQRMRELDRMKGLLTEEEYQRKRAEIMSDV